MKLKLKKEPSAKECLEFIENTLLIVSSLFIAIGVIFFIAYNWDGMGRLWKIALIEAFLVLSFGVYYFSSNPKLSKLFLYISAILIGALLALIGQIYQMGANRYELFLYWALLILPWAIINNTKTLWLIEIILLNISLGLYYLFNPLGVFIALENKFIPFFLFNLFAFIIWEVSKELFKWRGDGWERIVLASFVTISLILSLISSSLSYFILFLPYFIVAGLYYYHKKDIPILTLLAISFWLYILIAIFKAINWRYFWFGGLIILIITSILVGGYLIKELQKLIGEDDV